MEVVGKDENAPINWRKAAKAAQHTILDCMSMVRMLQEYPKLGKPKVVMENGVRITKCPPAYARGVFLDKSAGYSKKN